MNQLLINLHLYFDNANDNITSFIGSSLDIDALGDALDNADVFASISNMEYRNKYITIDNATEYKKFIESLISSLDVIVNCNVDIEH